MQGGCGLSDVAVEHDTASIWNALRAVARHSHNPTDRHWEAVLKMMAYLHGTRGMGFTFVTL